MWKNWCHLHSDRLRSTEKVHNHWYSRGSWRLRSLQRMRNGMNLGSPNIYHRYSTPQCHTASRLKIREKMVEINTRVSGIGIWKTCIGNHSILFTFVTKFTTPVGWTNTREVGYSIQTRRPAGTGTAVTWTDSWKKRNGRVTIWT
jgi:hypothetical protein